MKSYLIRFTQTADNNEQSLYWHCDADDKEHAMEQLRNEIEATQGERIVLGEVIEVNQFNNSKFII